jgi:hypothetical protein
MALSSPENGLGNFGVHDLHSFKDFVVYVLAYAPDMFPAEDWLRPDEQMNLDRAFVVLRYGLKLAAQEKGESPLLAKCRELVEEAYAEYRAGRDPAGQLKLEEMEKLLKQLPTE